MFLVLDSQTQNASVWEPVLPNLPLILRPPPMTVLPKELTNPRLHATCKGWRNASGPSSHPPPVKPVHLLQPP